MSPVSDENSVEVTSLHGSNRRMGMPDDSRVHEALKEGEQAHDMKLRLYVKRIRGMCCGDL